MDNGGITIRVKISIILLTLVVLLSAATAASACSASDIAIDVHPYSYPSPINLDDKGVVPVAIDGAKLCEYFYVSSVEDLGFQINYIYLKNPNDGSTYTLDFDRDATKLMSENVLIAPCGVKFSDDNVPDLSLKIRGLKYNPMDNDGRSLTPGDYYLYINYQVSVRPDNTYNTPVDCIKLVKL